MCVCVCAESIERDCVSSDKKRTSVQKCSSKEAQTNTSYQVSPTDTVLFISWYLYSSRTFSLSASFPKTTLQYWSSVYQQRGVECHVSSGTCDMKYTLQLIPYDDGLVRRPKTDWSVASLQGEVMDILTYTCTKQEEVDLVGDHVTVTC